MDSQFNNECDHEVVLMLLQHCMQQSLHKYNFDKLCSSNKSFKYANLIIKGFVSISKFYDELNFYFKYFANTYQYIYLMLFPKHHVNNDKFVIQNKVQLTMLYQNWKTNRPSVVVMPDVVIDTSKMGTNLIDFVRKVETFEQQPIKIDEIVPSFL